MPRLIKNQTGLSKSDSYYRFINPLWSVPDPVPMRTPHHSPNTFGRFGRPFFCPLSSPAPSYALAQKDAGFGEENGLRCVIPTLYKRRQPRVVIRALAQL